MASRLTPTRLAKADKQAEDVAKPFREARTQALAVYMGMDSDGKKGRRRPINPIAQAVNTLMAALTPDSLGYIIKPRRIDLTAEAEMRQVALRRIAEEQNLLRVYEDALMDALVGPFGIVMTGIKAGAEMVKINNEDVDPGSLFAVRIDLDDYAVDPMARHRGEAYWERHKYRVPRWFALESGVFAGHEDYIESMPGVHDLGRDEGASSLSGRQNDKEDSNVCDLIELADYAIYEGGRCRILTLPVSKDGVEGSYGFLMDQEYQGPEGSPYNVLQLFRVPDNVYGPSLVSMFADLADAIERVGAKMVSEGVKAKMVFAAEKSAAEDAESIRKARDQDVVLVDDVNALKQFDVGGVVKDLYQFFQLLRSEFNNASLSSQLIGGQDSIGSTATEASILQGNANRSIAWMRRKMATFFTSDAIRLGWYLQHDPLLRVPVPYRFPGTEWTTIEYTPEMRAGDFNDFGYEYSIDTMLSVDPAVKTKRIQEALATFTAGLQPVVAVGGSPQVWAKIISKQFDIEELDEVVSGPEFYMRQAQALQGVQMPGQGMPGQPAGMDPRQPQQDPQQQQMGGPMLANPTDQMRQGYAPAMQGGY